MITPPNVSGEPGQAPTLVETVMGMVALGRAKACKLEHRNHKSIWVVSHDMNETDVRDSVAVYLDALCDVCFGGAGGVIAEAVVLHGSRAMGAAVRGASDVDVLVVAEVPDAAVDELAAAIEALHLPDDASGLELSVVSRADIADRRRFKPFRLHCNVTRSTTRRVPGQGHEGDEDLTLHYAVAAARGVVLRGPDISEFFVSPPREDVATALVSELDWALENDNPTYSLLNASRALAFATDAVLLSKPEGWLWGRRHGLDPQLLDTALVSFLTRTDAVLPPEAAQDVLDLVAMVRAALLSSPGDSHQRKVAVVSAL